MKKLVSFSIERKYADDTEETIDIDIPNYVTIPVAITAVGAIVGGVTYAIFKKAKKNKKLSA